MSSAPLSDSQTPQLLAHSPTPPGAPSNDDIEAVIKMATSSRPSTDRPGPLRDTRTQLFVGNLPYRVRWQDLKDLFRRAGTVLRADVSLGPDNRSRGYGTVLLATAEDAGRAIDLLNGYCWQTRVLEVRPDRLGASVDEMAMNAAVAPATGGYVSPSFNLTGMNSSTNGYDEFAVGIAANNDLLSGGTGMRSLFVGNLPFHIQWQDLKDLFRAAGAVARADVALGPDGRSRGFGTVTFVTEDGAERARRMFDGYEFNGRPLKVHYDKFAQSAQTIPLVGVSPQPATTSILSHDSLPQVAITPQLHAFDALNANPVDLQAHLDALARARSRLELHPLTHVESSLDALTSTQLDALLMQSRSSSLTSTSPVPHVQSHSQSPLHLHSPSILHSQLQSLGAQSLAVSATQPLTPTPSHSLSRPHSLTGSPLPIAPSNAFGSLGHSDLSSSNLPVDSLSLKASTMDLKLAADMGLAADLKHTSDLKLTNDPLTSRASSFSSPRPSLSVGPSQPTSFVSSTGGTQRPSLSAGSSRTDLLSEGLGLGFGSQRPSFGSTNAEKPSLTSLTSERQSVVSQRPSFSSTSSQRPSLGSGQRSTAFLGAPSLEDDGSATSSSQVPALGALRPAMPLSTPSPSHVGEIGATESTSRGRAIV
ncbi:hypothetical protein F5I97DRAFT_1076702 [Phlebopus sp. FC_14]|nr:hypothetical protein F5I97DRAFT_1076702 [Phlebopus sp. FC_14]